MRVLELRIGRTVWRDVELARYISFVGTEVWLLALVIHCL